MYLSIETYAPTPTEVVLLDGARETGYTILEGSHWGNDVWDVALSGRRGTLGAQSSSASVQNRDVVLATRISGSDGADLAEKLDVLERVSDELRRFGGRLTWKSANQRHRVYFEIMIGNWAAGQWTKVTETHHRLEGVIALSCAPYALGDPLDFNDDFTSDSLQDYGFDSGNIANLTMGTYLRATASPTDEYRLLYIDRGYKYGDHQVTLKATPGATLTNFKAGVILKRIDADNYVEAFVTDNGTDSKLRIRVIRDGLVSFSGDTTITVRISNGTPLWIRGRFEGGVVYAEYFTSAPTPMGTPVHTTSRDISVDADDDELFGEGTVGTPGLVFTPQVNHNATVDDFDLKAYAYRSLTLPTTIPLDGAIPGNAPALCDVTVTPSGGSSAPVWALMSWNEFNEGGLDDIPFGVFQAEASDFSTNWGSVAGGLGGNYFKDSTVSGAESYSATWLVDPSLLPKDDFSHGETAIEVWARVELHAGLVTPKFTASLQPQDGTNYGGIRYTSEHGPSGRGVTLPSSGTAWRMIRLGTLSVVVDRQKPRKWKLVVEASTFDGSTGSIGIDYVLLTRAKSRACSPTGKPNDSDFPKFVKTTSETVKTILVNGQGLVAQPGKYGHQDSGLGGSNIELPPTDVDVLLKLSSLVPDDPTEDTTTEQESHSASVQFSITPRYHTLRPIG